ncbi:GFA family protein [Kutzneria chonburiensis]|uniref:GFA family protein n=1 Tax=Kutzneria chonburiensis TaxID=1483604 RepID=A0ABV6MRC2_9PSEU|nr:GFA family protein [Kutzneria chonburiensis]
MRTGHCLCGAISYSYDAEPVLTVLCHCDDCQRHTGSAFSENILVPQDSLRITGVPKVYNTVGSENGHVRDRLFCGDCGTPIFTVMRERPEIIIVKAGTLDDRSGVRPTAEVWTRRAQDWVVPTPDRVRFPGDAR